ncbi:mechanosensitive ion channel [Opitutaceae bacterium]|nr:mechanosensitive ion channel [Opitutaceae bacterium]
MERFHCVGFMVVALNLGEAFPQYIPLIVTMVIVAVGLTFADWALKKRSQWVGSRQNFVRPLVMLGITAVALIAIIIALPLNEGTTNQLLGLLGLVLTGIIGLSSTTFVSNAMAGLMLRSVGSFRSGDFIKVDAHFGRVSGRGLFHTEIQTEDRDLTTLPNLYLISNPVKVVRSSGTIVSANISLGYDASESRVEGLLVEAAKKAGLEDPFVHVVDLGDYTVSYRVSGFLADIKRLVTARSRLRIESMNTLHAAGIEVMSPAVMMQRPIPSETRIMPEHGETSPLQPLTDKPLPEERIFDKAEKAEAIERLEKELKEQENGKAELAKQLDGSGEKEKVELQNRIKEMDTQIERLRKSLEEELEQ